MKIYLRNASMKLWLAQKFEWENLKTTYVYVANQKMIFVHTATKLNIFKIQI